MTSRRRSALWLAAPFILACHGGGHTAGSPAQTPVPVGTPARAASVSPPFLGDSAAPGSDPAVPPEYARAAGYMPLASTGVEQFRTRHPTYDGRGVLIGVLDSGIDPAAPGLQVTTTGAPKILDLRDFSGEGHVDLRPVGSGATVTIAGRVLAGGGRIARLATGPVWYAGELRETDLGRLPGADLNGDAQNTDVFPVVVVRASDGWVAFIDANLDGSFEDDTPLHDYRDGREIVSFGNKPLTLAANFGEGATVPVLDLVFDDAGHGTHVAGVAAGHKLFGVDGFEGVAPGAQLLGLKITDNSRGGTSVTGSIMRAMSYAARFAAERGLPLILNLSFAVGNSEGRRAVLDSLVDAFLVAHPGIVLAAAAGNDGPGLGTLGSPASADLALAVGAALPLAFVRPVLTTGQPAAQSGDLMGWWSARGGTRLKPDIVFPGFAFSSVPRFATGEELKRGTSVGAPYASGFAACLVAALAQENRTVNAVEIAAALRASANPFPGTTLLDRGTGEPRLEAAYRFLAAGHQGSVYAVRTETGGSAALRFGVAPEDTVTLFRVRHLAGLRAAQFVFRSSVPWLRPPATMTAGPLETVISVRATPPQALPPGVYTGTVTARNPSDTLGGPLFNLVSTLVVPYDLAAQPLEDLGRSVPAARVQRYFLRVPRPGATLLASVTTPDSFPAHAAVRLYEPGGRPVREVGTQSGTGTTALVRAEDVIPGVYELDVIAPPLASFAPSVRAQLGPLELGAGADGNLEIENPGTLTVEAKVTHVQLGVERRYSVTGHGAPPESLAVSVPVWAATATVDVELPATLWSELTGFGVTQCDSAGRQVAGQPLHFPVGRQRFTVPAALAGHSMTIELSPAFARAEGVHAWTGSVRVRFFQSTEQPLGGETTVTVVPGARASVALPAVSANSVPPGFEALVEARVRAGGVTAVRRLTAPVRGGER